MKNKIFIITAGIGLILVGVSSSLLFVKNTFGSNIFATEDRGCVPYNIFVERGSAEYSVKITWNTRDECVGFILYGAQRGNLNLVGIDQKNKTKSMYHEVVLEKLLKSQRYYFLVNSNDATYGANGNALNFSIEKL